MNRIWTTRKFRWHEPVLLRRIRRGRLNGIRNMYDIHGIQKKFGRQLIEMCLKNLPPSNKR